MASAEPEIETELRKVISTVSKEKGLDKAVIVDALEQAIIHAARRTYGVDADLEAHYNEEIDKVELFQFRTVVEEVTDKDLEIIFADAKKLDPECGVGDSLGVNIDEEDFFAGSD